MSRLIAILVSLFYVVGGLVTGYYSYALRIQAQASETGIDMAALTEFTQANYSYIGVIMLILAFLFHMGQLFNSRRVNTGHVNNETALKESVDNNRNSIAALEAQVTDNSSLIEFCRKAISNTNEQYQPPASKEQAKDYAETKT